MALVFRFAARSDVGKVRAKNDDSAYAGRYLAVVADGMGGHAGGNIASASTVLDLVHLDRKDYDGDAGTHLADEIQTANSLLSELVSTNPQLAGMGTTVTAMLLNGEKISFAHIGDSRAYRLKNDVFEQISVDHTFVQRLIEEGRLKPEEAEVHPHKNVLMRVLGDVDASPELDLTTFDAEPGERWLLCSDGLNAVLDDATVERIIRETRDLSACVNTLVDLTLAGGSPDNITIVVVDVDTATPEDLRTAALTALPPAREAAGEKDSDASIDDATPGVAIRADVIREDLSSRPHTLVGSAALATETGQIPIVTQRSTERRAAMMLTHKAAPADAVEDDQTEEASAPRRRRWLLPAALALMALILAAVLSLGYVWTQTRYYVATFDNRVAIYNGVAQTLGPIPLSHVDQTTDIPVSSLPEFQRNRLENTLAASDLEHAQDIVEDLRQSLRALPCPPESNPSPSASPSPTVSASPETASPEPSSSGSPTPEPSASASPASPGATVEASPSASASADAAPGEAASCGGRVQ
ncbi:serine/threonine protein phosphatase [Arthrobacter sp. Soil782]|uniref:PP2C family protein-serine/threonine phosphatase n=1 Tax=Arthrobacter sp. Soil782 TaxID=1736410 RepID=UPI0006FBD775|nr:PP2C family serine/threonine-protein phosphatase [Arthrobacter sp. Soil782]KRF09041.1 serine/threonine protein phosphatase [Arthrobacter sp. Soil782]